MLKVKVELRLASYGMAVTRLLCIHRHSCFHLRTRLCPPHCSCTETSHCRQSSCLMALDPKSQVVCWGEKWRRKYWLGCGHKTCSSMDQLSYLRLEHCYIQQEVSGPSPWKVFLGNFSIFSFEIHTNEMVLLFFAKILFGVVQWKCCHLWWFHR